MQNQCFFIGHRNAPASIYNTVLTEVEHLILTQNINHFVVGHYGTFDHMCATAVTELKTTYPQVTLTMLLPYHPAVHPVHLPSGFDGSLYPFEEHHVPHYAAIVAANHYMIDHSSHLIVYAKYVGSNARNYVDYAMTRVNKGLLQIINLADKV